MNSSLYQIEDAVMPESLNSLLFLITTILLVDKASNTAGKRTVVQDVHAVSLVRELGFNLSAAKLLFWFDLNQDYVLERLDDKNFSVWYEDLLSGLSNYPHKPEILNIMQQIAQTHHNGGVNAKALIRLTEQYWANRR